MALLFFTGLTFVIRLYRTDRLLPSWGRVASAPAALAAPANADNPPLGQVFSELFRHVAQPRSLRIFGYIWAVYLAFSVFFGSFIYTLIHALHWAAKDVSVLEGSWANAVVLVVLVAGGLLSDRLGPARLQVWVLGFIVLVIAGVSAAGSQWGHPPVATGGILVASLVDPFMSVAALPLLMNLCDRRVAGSQFTTYMALINFGDVIGARITGLALGIAPAPAIGACCAGVVLLALWQLRRANLAPRQCRRRRPRSPARSPRRGSEHRPQAHEPKRIKKGPEALLPALFKLTGRLNPRNQSNPLQAAVLLAVYFLIVHVGDVVAGGLALAVAVAALRLAVGAGETARAGLAAFGATGGVHLL